MRALARQAQGAGRLDAEDVTRGRAEHPVCGDELEVDVRIVDGSIAELAWRAVGCPATMAVAACLSRAWVGVAVVDAPAALDRTLGALGGLAAHERHAASLAARALEAAARGAGS
jgi:NifU-like protein involved in Fe-S cluster formation